MPWNENNLYSKSAVISKRFFENLYIQKVYGVGIYKVYWSVKNFEITICQIDRITLISRL